MEESDERNKIEPLWKTRPENVSMQKVLPRNFQIINFYTIISL